MVDIKREIAGVIQGLKLFFWTLIWCIVYTKRLNNDLNPKHFLLESFHFKGTFCLTWIKSDVLTDMTDLSFVSSITTVTYKVTPGLCTYTIVFTWVGCAPIYQSTTTNYYRRTVWFRDLIKVDWLWGNHSASHTTSKTITYCVSSYKINLMALYHEIKFLNQIYMYVVKPVLSKSCINPKPFYTDILC